MEVQTEDKSEINAIQSLPELYRNFEIVTADHCQQAATVLSDAKKRVAVLEERRKQITKPLDDAKKSVMDLFRPATDACAALERIIKPKIAHYHNEQERIRREAQAKAEEEARKERARLEAQAAKAREKGKEERAEALEIKAATTVAVTPAIATQKITGASVRKVWSAEVIDVIELCKAIVAGDIPPTVIDFKQSELNRLATTWQNNRAFPGLRISQQSVVMSR
jgi:hypothetical protein